MQQSRIGRRLHYLSSRISLLTTTLLLTTPSSQSPSPPSQQCDCYLVSGAQPGYFSNHYFIDFRNLTSNLPSNATANDTTPLLIPSTATVGSEPPTNPYFTDDPMWTSFWSIENTTNLFNWSDGGSYSQVASPQNVWLCPADYDMDGNNDSAINDDSNSTTFLAMRTTRNKDFASVAEFSSINRDMLYLSLRARIRVLPQNDSLSAQSVVDEGGVFGLFTYQSDTQESDFEILTRDDTHTLHCSNQPDYDPSTDDTIPGTSEAVQLGAGKRWTDWMDVRLDWFQGQSRWYIDGNEVWNMTKNVPGKPSGVNLNVWSDGGSWSGDMSVGGMTVVGVQWIEVAYNTSSNTAKGQCALGCWIDGDQVKDTGTPALAYNSTTAQSSGAASSSYTGGNFGFGLAATAITISMLLAT